LTKIKTDVFKNNAKIINTVVEKGNPYKEAIYLDFENGMVYGGYEDSVYKMRFPFTYEGDKHESFFIEANTFLSVCNKYEELELNDFRFTCGKDKFKLATIKREFDSVINFDSVSGNRFDTKEFTQKLKESSQYASMEKEQLKGIFLQDQLMVGFNGERLLMTKLEASTNDYIVPLNVIKLILATSNNVDVVLFKDETKVKIVIGDCELLIANNNALSIPNFNTPQVQSVFKHNNFIKINAKEFHDGVEFILSFASKNMNNRAKLIIKENELILKNEESDCDVEKVLEITQGDSELVDKEFWLNMSDVNIACNSISKDENETLKLRLPIDNSGSNKAICISLDEEVNDKGEEIESNKEAVIVLIKV